MFISKFNLDEESYVIGNRTSATEMANDCWYLSVSIKNEKIENECFETIFKAGTSNISQLNESNLVEKESSSRINKLVSEVESMKLMVESLVASNKTLLQLNKDMHDELKSMRAENQSLRKMILEHNTNLTINREFKLSVSSVESIANKRRRLENDTVACNVSNDGVFKIPQMEYQ